MSGQAEDQRISAESTIYAKWEFGLLCKYTPPTDRMTFKDERILIKMGWYGSSLFALELKVVGKDIRDKDAREGVEADLLVRIADAKQSGDIEEDEWENPLLFEDSGLDLNTVYVAEYRLAEISLEGQVVEMEGKLRNMDTLQGHEEQSQKKAGWTRSPTEGKMCPPPKAFWPPELRYRSLESPTPKQVAGKDANILSTMNETQMKSADKPFVKVSPLASTGLTSAFSSSANLTIRIKAPAKTGLTSTFSDSLSIRSKTQVAANKMLTLAEADGDQQRKRKASEVEAVETTSKKIKAEGAVEEVQQASEGGEEDDGDEEDDEDDIEVIMEGPGSSTAPPQVSTFDDEPDAAELATEAGAKTSYLWGRMH